MELGNVFIMPTTFIFIKVIIRFRFIYRRCFLLPEYYLLFKVVNRKLYKS